MYLAHEVSAPVETIVLLLHETKKPRLSGVGVSGGCVGFEGEMGLFQADAAGALLGVSTTLPSRASHPMAHSKMVLALRQLLELRERKLAVGIESVPNGTRHLAYVFLDGNAHLQNVISIDP